MRQLAGLGLIFAALLLSGCDRVFDALPGNYTDIVAIDAGPAAFEGQVVRVKGTVASATKLPFADQHFFTLRTRSGQELQVSSELALPAIGQEVWSQGRIENLSIIKGMGMGVYLKETRRICQPRGGEGHYEKLLNCLTGQ